MCGICGIVFNDRAQRPDPALLQRMAARMCHRGPDETGFHVQAGAGLGHSRLSIIDLSGGRQPLFNETGELALTFNGEIYNFPELRGELERRGHRFATRTDSETILHLYEEMGERCVERLRGMFAFAIYDAPRHRLFAARDRLGKKPFYFATRPGCFLFASELKALLAHPEISRELDPVALDEYLTFQYVPAPRTILRGVEKLRAAHVLLYEDGQVKTSRYWRPEYFPKRQISADAAGREALEQIEDAVRCRLISDVPLGCFLSGGIDSSLVVAMMRRHVGGPLRTFSIGFREAGFDELPYARAIARHFETQHEEFVVEVNAVSVLPRLVWHYDEPFADSSGLPTFLLSELTRRHVTVALNGDGGDESFAGYQRYADCGFAIFNVWRRIPAALRRWLIGPLAAALRAALPQSGRLELLDYVNRASLWDDDARYCEAMRIFRPEQKQRLYRRELAAQIHAAGLGDPMGRTRQVMAQLGAQVHRIDRMAAGDLDAYLPDCLLVKVDRATMAHSLEGRSPFLDHRVVEFAAKLPAELRMLGGVPKGLLRKYAAPLFPPGHLDRPKKGFTLPVREWLREGALQRLATELLLSRRLGERTLFDPKYIRLLLDQHARGTQNHHYRLWALMCFELWCRTFLDSDGSAPLE
ncbi:MAG: asparagine synthase (glutamine-hydrolyzing) [Candidatus Sumerlaeia bacterium]|nr:asparagine synthase (glutamine-hydrolyzing) [Candidatus Sumerlaeia bacterium]